MDLTDIKPTIIDSEESLKILPKPRSFTFDNPAMVRRLLYEYNWFYYMNLSCILYAVINLWSSGYPLRLSLFFYVPQDISKLFTFINK